MKRTSLPRLFLGTVVLALGLGMLLDALNIIEFGDYFKTWWPVLVIIAGLLGIFSNPRMWVWPLVIVACGVVLLLNSLGFVSFSIWSLLWPGIVILFGLSLLFKRSVIGEGKPQPAKSKMLNLSAVFSGHKTRADGQEVAGGNLTAVFGGIDLDLSDSKLGGDVNFEVFVALGGISLRVPRDCVVKIEVLPIMGGWEDNTRKPADISGLPTITIRGTCVWGGLEIKD